MWVGRIGLIVSLALSLLMAPLAANAQQAGKVYRIGYLGTVSRQAQLLLIKAFEDALRDRGWVPGRNLVIEYRFADGKFERLPELAQDLVHLKVDVILTGVNPGTVAARQATSTIPIVMAVGLSPVEEGLVQSLARPGGNITGLTFETGPENHGKRLQLLKEIVPGLSRVAVLWNPDDPRHAGSLKEVEPQARALGLTPVRVQARAPGELEAALAAAAGGRAGAVYVLAGPPAFPERVHVAELATRNRLPTVYFTREEVEAGGLLAYGPSLPDNYRRAAGYVDRILKGAKPADLPVEQPTRFELVINLKRAKALGLTIPQSILIRADKVIQ